MLNWAMFKAIHNGGEQHAFEQMCYELFCHEYNRPFGIDRKKNQPAIETDPIDYNGEFIGFQAKFLETKLSNNSGILKKAVEDSRKYYPKLNVIIFYISEEFSFNNNNPEGKSKTQSNLEKFAETLELKIVWKSRSHIEAQLSNGNLSELKSEYFSYSIDNFKITQSINIQKRDETLVSEFHIERYVRIGNSGAKIASINLLSSSGNFLLLGEAASGKSEELKYYNDILLSRTEIYQYYYPLKNYQGEDIEIIIPENYASSDKTILLFDAIDEIRPEALEIFLKKINTFSNKNSKVKIIISSRYNFYQDRMLDEFEVAFLCELEEGDYIAFINKELSCDGADFVKKITDLNDKSLVNNPFYLKHNISFYKENKQVFDRIHILQNNYDKLFEKEKSKFRKIGNNTVKEKLLQDLSNLALISVCNGVTDLSPQLYESFSVDELYNIKSFGWVKYYEPTSTIGFAHNNYKEYLAAVALKDYPDEEVKKLISIEIDRIYIRPQFHNVLGFLMKLRNSNEIKKYLVDFGKEILMETDNAPLSIDDKFNIVKNIIEEYQNKGSWLSAAWFQEEKIARICDNLKTIEYLISKLNIDVHRTTVISVLHILGKVNILYCKENEIKKNLYTLLENDLISTDGYYLSDILKALADMGLNNDEAKLLYSKYSLSNQSVVRGAANYIIFKNKLGEYFVKELLRGRNRGKLRAKFINEFDDDENDITDMSESLYITMALKDLNSSKALVQYGEYLIEEERRDKSSNLKEEFFNKLLSIDALDDSLKEILYKIILQFRKFRFEDCTKIIREIIIKNQLSHYYLNRIAGSSLEVFYKADIYALIYVDEIKQDLLTLFSRNIKLYNYKDSFANNIANYVEEYENVLQWFTLNNIPMRLQKNYYQEKQEQRKHLEFEMLFDENVTKSEIKKIFEFFKKDVLQPKEIRKMLRMERETYFPAFVIDFFTDGAGEGISLNEIDNIDFDWYRIYKIYEMINSASIDKTQVTDSQKDYIKKWCDKVLENVNYKTALTYKDGGGHSTTWDALMIATFIVAFDFNYDKMTLKCFAYYEWPMLKNHSMDAVLLYIESKLDRLDFKAAVKEAVNSGNLKGSVLDSRLKSCIKYRISECLPFVITHLTNADTISEPHTLLEYLSEMGHLHDALISYESYDKNLKMSIINQFKKHMDFSIIPYIEKDITLNDDNSILYAEKGVELNSEIAIDYFINWSEENGKIAGESGYYDLDFSVLNSIEDLPNLLRFLELTYKYRKKIRFDTFSSNVLSAIKAVALASLDNLKETIKQLHVFIETHGEYENVSYLNWYIDTYVKSFLDSNHCL